METTLISIEDIDIEDTSNNSANTKSTNTEDTCIGDFLIQSVFIKSIYSIRDACIRSISGFSTIKYSKIYSSLFSILKVKLCGISS